MSVYLHDIPLKEAKARLQAALVEAGLWRVLAAETLLLDENLLGRVLAEPIWAKSSSPHYHASAMDGFAVRAEETAGAQPSQPVTLASFKYVDTGDALPAEFNAVIQIENVESLADSSRIAPDPRQPYVIRIRAAVPPWSHVRPLGEDIVATQLVLPAGHVLQPADLGALAAAGHTTVNVSRKPRVAILPTGTELVPIGSDLKPGDILEYNSLVLAAQIKKYGGEATRYPITADNFDLICERVGEAAQTHDLVLLNAGSSAGSEDFSSRVVEKLGTLLVHGVAVRPGHPVILGMINERRKMKDEGDPSVLGPSSFVPIIGVPGYPVSAALTVEIFVEELVAHWLGRAPATLPVIEAQITRKTNSPAGDDDYIRVLVGKVGERMLAAPLARGAGTITSLVRADGLVVLPRGVQGVDAGDKVAVHLYRTLAEIEQTIFAIGSHDIALDVMSQHLAQHGRRLVSANVGSQGGLVALKRGEAHIAGSHLLDPATGEYNVLYIRQYMPDIPVKVVTLAGRDQGLLVKKGNPKNIKDLHDLVRQDVAFVNRQRGAGTRVLLDYQLTKMDVVPTLQIRGYDNEEYTHLAVAAAIASGRADCGLGIPAAAVALDLDFIPLFQERYDLVIPKEHAQSDLLAPLLELLYDKDFRAAVAAMPGYNVSVMGQVVLDD